MAFSSSVAAYNLDHHSHQYPNWHHQLQQHQQQPNNNSHQQLLQNTQLLPPQPPPGEGSIRPGSMVDRARLAKLPLPEAGLNCPRCDSTQTKFCYFNNYSLTQPRHFCKTCRRYWTRGGALRSVPVGGGCRRNKRSKSRNSKSPNITNNQKGPSNNISAESPSSSADQMVANNNNNNNNNPFSSQVPIMAALQNINGHFGSATAGAGSYGGFQIGTGSLGQSETSFQIGQNGSSLNNINILSSGGAQAWRLPILSAFEQSSAPNLFSYQGEGIEAASAGQVKIEESRGGLNLSRQFLGASDPNTLSNNNNVQYWGGGGGNSWTTDFSSQINNTSSTSPFL